MNQNKLYFPFLVSEHQVVKLFTLYTVKNQKGKKREISGKIYLIRLLFPPVSKEVLADDKGKAWDVLACKEWRSFSWSEMEYFQDETAESMRGTCVVAVWWVGAS